MRGNRQAQRRNGRPVTKPQPKRPQQQPQRSPQGKIRAFGYGHIGARADVRGYEDRHFAGTIETPLGPLTVAIVADGVGGSGFGERAAELAVESVIEALQRTKQTSIPKALGEAIGYANRRVFRLAQQYRDRSRRDMSTTLAIAVVHNGRLYVANVGDSRVYLLRGDDLRQITIDHTWANERHRYQGIPLEEALRHPNAHILMRSLGREPKVKVDLGLYLNGLKEDGARAFRNQGLPLQGDEVILVCSDGLVKNQPGTRKPLVSREEMIQILHAGTAEQSAKMLVDLAVSRGADDNVTAVVIEMPKHKPRRAMLSRLSPKALVLAASIIAVAILGLGLMLPRLLPPPPPPPGDVRVVRVAPDVRLGVGSAAALLERGMRFPRTDAGYVYASEQGAVLLKFRGNHLLAAGSNTAFMVGIDPEWEFGGAQIFQQLQANVEQEKAGQLTRFYQPVLLSQGSVIVRTDPGQPATFDVFLADRGYQFRAQGTVLGVCYDRAQQRVQADCFEGTCSMAPRFGEPPQAIPAGQRVVLDLQTGTQQMQPIDYAFGLCYQGLEAPFLKVMEVPTATPTPIASATPTIISTPTPSRRYGGLWNELFNSKWLSP